MKRILFLVAIAFFSMVFLSLTITNSEFKKEWEAVLIFQDGRHDPVTSIHSYSGKIFVTNPLGVEVFDLSGNRISEISNIVATKQIKSKAPSIGGVVFGGTPSKGITIGGGNKTADEPMVPLKKIVYLPVHHLDGVLEFNYDESKEAISYYRSDSSTPVWSISDLHWSPESYRQIADFFANNVIGANSDFNSRMSAGLTAGIFFPDRYVQNISTIIPGKNLMLLNTIQDGLACINLENGKVNWISSDTKGGISHIIVDEKSNPVLTFGGNPFWFPEISRLVQSNKKLVNLNLDTGSLNWDNQFTRNLITKNQGMFDMFDKPDIRLLENKLLLNFYEIEMYDYKSGKLLFISEGVNDGVKSADGFIGSPSKYVAFPVIENDILYRTYITKILAFGASVGGVDPNNREVVVEASDANTGKQLWKTEPISRSTIINMDVYNDFLLVGFNNKEGIWAFDKNSGHKVWNYELGRRGNTSRWLMSEKYLIVSEFNTIHVIDPSTGELIHKIDVKKTSGNILEFYLDNDVLTVLGNKDGIANYNIETGTLIHTVKTGYYPLIHTFEDRFIISSYDPNDSFLILDRKSLASKGGLPKSKHRTSLSWSEDRSSVYEIVKGKLI